MSKLDEQCKVLDRRALEIEKELAYFRRKYSTKAYIKWIEAMYVCAQLNWDTTLDEVLELRAKTRKTRKTRA